MVRGLVARGRLLRLAIAFVVVFETVPFAKFQTGRFFELGGSAYEILLSPVVRPAAFWGTVVRPQCGYFLLCLAVPLGLPSLRRGWPVLLTLALPVLVLLAWQHPSATSIAFQYTTSLIPFLFLAAMVGAAVAGMAAGTVPIFAAETASSQEKGFAAAKMGLSPSAGAAVSGMAGGTDDRSGSLGRAGLTALAAGLAASLWIGAMPWSSPTLSQAWVQTYHAASGDFSVYFDRLTGAKGNAVLRRAVAMVATRDSAVLASGRIAAHLLMVRRLETVGQACARWKATPRGGRHGPIRD